jgi:hypothetical protein
MGRLSNKEKSFQEGLVDSLINLIRLTSTGDDDVKHKFNTYIKNEELSPYQKKYFEKKIFGEIEYSETKRKMLILLNSNISKCTFSGKEIKNIQRFFREQKLNKIDEL